MGLHLGQIYDVEVEQRHGGIVMTKPIICPYESWQAFWSNWHLVSRESERASVNLPVRPFLYTLDQVASLIHVTEARLKNAGYVFFVGRTSGVQSKDEMLAVNIAPSTAAPDWRIEERELIRWMKRKGFRFVG